MNSDISALSESKYRYASSRKYLYVCIYVRARMCVRVCNKFVSTVAGKWKKISS